MIKNKKFSEYLTSIDTLDYFKDPYKDRYYFPEYSINTAFILACKNGQIEVVKTLMEKKIFAKLHPQAISCALFAATKMEQDIIVKLLIDSNRFNEIPYGDFLRPIHTDIGIEDALFIAIQTKNIKIRQLTQKTTNNLRITDNSLVVDDHFRSQIKTLFQSCASIKVNNKCLELLLQTNKIPKRDVQLMALTSVDKLADQNVKKMLLTYNPITDPKTFLSPPKNRTTIARNMAAISRMIDPQKAEEISKLYPPIIEEQNPAYQNDVVTPPISRKKICFKIFLVVITAPFKLVYKFYKCCKKKSD